MLGKFVCILIFYKYFQIALSRACTSLLSCQQSVEAQVSAPSCPYILVLSLQFFGRSLIYYNFYYFKPAVLNALLNDPFYPSDTNHLKSQQVEDIHKFWELVGWTYNDHPCRKAWDWRQALLIIKMREQVWMRLL